MGHRSVVKRMRPTRSLFPCFRKLLPRLVTISSNCDIWGLVFTFTARGFIRTFSTYVFACGFISSLPTHVDRRLCNTTFRSTLRGCCLAGTLGHCLRGSLRCFLGRSLLDCCFSSRRFLLQRNLGASFGRRLGDLTFRASLLGCRLRSRCFLCGSLRL